MVEGKPSESDSIATPRGLEDWLLEQRLVHGRLRLCEVDVAHAQAVREALRDLLATNEGQKIAKGAVETLARAARSAQLLLAFTPEGQALLRPSSSGVDAALGELLAITFRSILDGSWQRLKACHDDHCRWAFYDSSKNRSGAWCAMGSCGNRAKARAYRARHA